MNAQGTWEEAVRSLLLDPTQRALVEDCYYDQPIEQAAERFWRSEEWKSVRRTIGCKPGAQALDVGAGNGIVSFALAKDGWATTALEPDPSDLVGGGSIRRLSEVTGTPICVVAGAGEEAPVPDGTFDLVIARQVLHHARDLDAFCADMARVMRPGALFFSYRDHVVSGPHQMEEFLDQHALHHLYGGENAFTEAAYEKALTAAGLRIIKRWRQFEADFNFAPKSRSSVASEAFARLLPHSIAHALGKLAGGAFIYPAFGALLSAIDRRPGRAVAYAAIKTQT